MALSEAISESIPQSTGFIRGYCEYASYCSDAPEIFHVGVALTILAGGIAKRLICPWMAGRALVPNLYTLLVGPSRSARKTGSMDIGVDVLQSVSPETVIPIPGSYEELIAQVRDTPSGLLTYREFGHFLKTTQRGYGEQIRTVLMDLYDHPPNLAYTRNLRKGKTLIEPPICLSMLSACSTDLLFLYTDSSEWMGGFFGRMLMLYGERETFRMPLPWEPARDWLRGMLHRYMNAPIPQCGGFDTQAWQAFEQWSRWRDSQSAQYPSRVQSFVSGAATLAAKIALLYAADAGEPNAGHGWMISYESIRRAMMFVEKLYLPSVTSVGERLALSIWERDRQKVLDVVRNHPAGVDRPKLLRMVKVSSDLLESILTTLKEERSIELLNDPKLGVVIRIPTMRAQQQPPPQSPQNGQVIPFPGAVG